MMYKSTHLSLAQSLSLWVWCWAEKLVVRTYRLWQIYVRPEQVTSNEVSGSSLPTGVCQFPAVYWHAGPATCCSLACHERQCRKLWLVLFSFLFCSHDHSSETAPYTSSEPVDNRPFTQEGKQTCQESASTSKRLRYNQAPVKNVDCHRLVKGPKLDDTKSSSVTVLSIGLAQNSAGLFLKTHYHCISITVCSVMFYCTHFVSRYCICCTKVLIFWPLLYYMFLFFFHGFKMWARDA